MAIFYDVLTDAQLEKIEHQKSGVMTEGVWKGQVVSSVQKISKTGQDMFEISISFHDKDSGDVYTKKDWLTPANKNMYFKYKHFCESCGDQSLLSGNTEDYQLMDKIVYALIQNKKETFTDKNGVRKEEMRSSIKDYVTESQYIDTQPLDDVLPF